MHEPDQPRLIEVEFPLKQASLDLVLELRLILSLLTELGRGNAVTLLRVQDSFGKLVVQAKGGVRIDESAIFETQRRETELELHPSYVGQVFLPDSQIILRARKAGRPAQSNNA